MKIESFLDGDEGQQNSKPLAPNKPKTKRVYNNRKPCSYSFRQELINKIDAASKIANRSASSTIEMYLESFFVLAEEVPALFKTPELLIEKLQLLKEVLTS